MNASFRPVLENLRQRIASLRRTGCLRNSPSGGPSIRQQQHTAGRTHLGTRGSSCSPLASSPGWRSRPSCIAAGGSARTTIVAVPI